MKLVLLCLTLFAGVTTWAQMAPICTAGNTQTLEFCQRMKHLRATANLIDSQRVLMKVDYPFLQSLASSLGNNSQSLIQLAPAALTDHVAGLQKIKAMSEDMGQLAAAQNPDVMIVANNVGKQCLNCHSSKNPDPNIIWNDMFSFNWDKISNECSLENRNPYLCKSMNALASNFNHIVTAYIAKVEDYSVTASVANEIVQILKNLKVLHFNHLGEENRAFAEHSAMQVIQLANNKDPRTFNQARNLNQACMQCHNAVAINKYGLTFK